VAFRHIWVAAIASLGCVAAAGQAPGIEQLQLRADHGEAQAQAELGLRLRHNEVKDFARGAAWLLKAASQGHSGAQLACGRMVLNGEGMAADAATGAQWIRRSAEQGNATAQDLLSGLHSNGTGVPQDDKAAFDWAILAADQGDPWAQFDAGHPKSMAFIQALGAELSDAPDGRSRQAGGSVAAHAQAAALSR
jgi:TPR repeat protein